MILVCCSQPFDLRRHDQERILQRRHERAPLRIKHGDRHRISDFGFRISDFKNPAPLPRRARRIIERAHESLFVRQQFHHFLLIPQMIAAGDDIHAGGKDFLGGPGGDATAPGGVLAVGDDEIQPMLLAQFRQQRLDRHPAGPAHYVTDEENFHAPQLITKGRQRHARNTVHISC